MRKQIIIVIALHVFIFAGAVTVNAITSAPQQTAAAPTSSPATAENDQKSVNSPENPESSKKQSPQKPQEAAEIVETYVEPSETAAQPAAPQSAPQPAKKEAGGHIPFTNKPVTAGDPESYVDTVGQCPFYEMAGPKGCVPPPDIECNADWSECKPKEEIK